MVYNSEYCNESLPVLQDEMTFEEFSEISDSVFYYSDLKEAAERDQKVQQNKQKQMNELTRGH